ncbi:MAG: TolC family protein [Prevotellaceae bacterium]|nr:TolC family protein [Prevotellaceae bacterium]
MKRTFLINILAVASISTAAAQPLTLEQCRTMALAHNKTLSSAKLKMEQSLYDMKSYRANYFPQINLMATDFYSTAKGDLSIAGGHLPIYNYVDANGQYLPNVTVNPDGTYTLNQYADFPDQKIEWKVKNVFMGGISLMQPLYAGGKISTAYKMSQLGAQMANENIRLTEEDIIVKTDEAYYMVVRAKEMGKVAQSYKALLEELMKNVEAAFRHGMKTRNDVMKVQVKLNEATLSIQKTDNAHRLALMNLCHLTGMPLDTNIEVAEDNAETPSSNSASSTTLTVTSRPEYSILQNRTELARQNVKLTQSDHLPNIALGAAYNYANGAELAGKRLLDNGSLTVGIAVKMPIDIFGGATNKMRSAKAAHQIALLEQQDLTEQMQLELQQCINNADEAAEEVRLCETALSQAAQNMQLSKQQYEVGFETLSDYLEAQAEWQQCSANLVNARCQLHLAYTKLLKAAGQLTQQ